MLKLDPSWLISDSMEMLFNRQDLGPEIFSPRVSLVALDHKKCPFIEMIYHGFCVPIWGAVNKFSELWVCLTDKLLIN